MPRLYFDVILIRKPDTTTTLCYGLFLCRTSSFTFLKHVFMNIFTFHHDLNGRKRKIYKRITYTAQNKLILDSFTKKNPTRCIFCRKSKKWCIPFTQPHHYLAFEPEGGTVPPISVSLPKCMFRTIIMRKK